MRLNSPISRIARTRRKLRRGWTAFNKGDMVVAEQVGRSVIAEADEPKPDIAHCRETVVSAVELVGCVRRELGDFQEAAALHEQALAALNDGPRSAPEDCQDERLKTVVLLRLGETLRLLGRYREAESHHLRAVDLAHHLNPPDAMLVSAAPNGLGIVYKDTQRYSAAANQYHQALTVAESEVGAEGPELADLHHNLAGLQHAQDNFGAGEPHARRALELRTRQPGLGSTAAAGDFAVLGAILLGQARYTEAEHHLERSLRIWQSRFGPEHCEVAVVLHNLAALYAGRGEHARAEHAYTAVLNIKTRILGVTNPDVVALQNHVDSHTQHRSSILTRQRQSGELRLHVDSLRSAGSRLGSGSLSASSAAEEPEHV